MKFNIKTTKTKGVYLPLIWEPSFCFKSPIALGYTRGHFTALVPLDRSEIYTYMPNNLSQSNNSSSSNSSQNNSNNPNNDNSGNTNLMQGTANNPSATTNATSLGAVSSIPDFNGGGGGGGGDNQQIFYLPLTNNEGQLLPVHFLTHQEVNRNIPKYL
jgi:hypothetical protein